MNKDVKQNFWLFLTFVALLGVLACCAGCGGGRDEDDAAGTPEQTVQKPCVTRECVK